MWRKMCDIFKQTIKNENTIEKKYNSINYERMKLRREEPTMKIMSSNQCDERTN